MTAAELLISLNGRGVVIVPGRDGSLQYRPRYAVSAAELADLARHREAIVALFDADPIAWRSAAMRAQIPPTGATPMLLARPAAQFNADSCCSCGDRLTKRERYRCGLCVQATVEALATKR